MIISALRNTICTIGLLLIMPIICIASFAVFLEDGFPFFFRQKRVGLNQKIFTIYKVRTLKKNAPQVGTHELNNDFQLKTGRIIRKFKLDEFPQLVNVLKGDINIVGPRPGLVIQSELFDERSSKNIYSIKPGITGLAQILGYDVSNPRKLAEIDETYIINRSLIINFLIILGTFFNLPKKILRKKFEI